MKRWNAVEGRELETQTGCDTRQGIELETFLLMVATMTATETTTIPATIPTTESALLAESNEAT